MSTQGTMVQSTAFVGWRETSRELKQERVVEELRREMVTGKAKATLMELVGMQEGLLLPTTFGSWREVFQEVRQERELEALRFAMEWAKLKIQEEHHEIREEGKRDEMGVNRAINETIDDNFRHI